MVDTTVGESEMSAEDHRRRRRAAVLRSWTATIEYEDFIGSTTDRAALLADVRCAILQQMAAVDAGAGSFGPPRSQVADSYLTLLRECYVWLLAFSDPEISAWKLRDSPEVRALLTRVDAALSGSEERTPADAGAPGG